MSRNISAGHMLVSRLLSSQEERASPRLMNEPPDHCIEVLRESAMCQADISLVTWEWQPNRELPFANFNVKHECRNWGKIMEWTKQHQAPEDLIVRPESMPWPPVGKSD